MSILLNSLRKYPVSIISYILYSLLCLNEYQMGMQMEEMVKNEPDKNHLLFGEGMMYGMIFLWASGIIFILVIFANAIARKENKFYLWLGAVVIVQLITISAVIIR
ncbi:MAG TPA: hypothetical protein VHC47_01685 [Mucilaginibacter sp.]|nr:hypothetical protein [Mucilaginibacter sp.]